MKSIVRIFAVVFLASLLADGQSIRRDTDEFSNVEYVHTKEQKKQARIVKGTLSLNGEKKSIEFLNEEKESIFTTKYDAITAMTYEQSSKPRYAEAVLISPLFLLSPSKKHFLTIQYTDDNGAGQYVVFHLSKKNARQVVAAAEARTGKKVMRAEEK